LWKRPQLGFLAFWCLGILAPTSTFIPIEAEIGSEHRMYLPLIAVVIAIVLAIWWIGGNSKSAAKKAAFAAITAVLAVMTFQRNIQYRSERGLWQQVVNQYPNDPRAHMNLGADALDNKNWQLAAKEYLVAARINPRTTDGRSCVQNAISALWELNEDAEIEHVYTQQIATDPSFAARWYLYRGEARKTSGLTPASQEDFQAARQAAKEKLQREPQDEESYVVIGVASEELGDIAEARDALTKANQLKIDLFARNELAKLTEKRNAQ
jgi:tetratricopeptide (TPR) repeat protein